MKRLWLVLLSLGLIVAFSTSAMAVDVKFSGEFYAAGLYLDKTTFQKDTASSGPSTAFYFQRLRLRTDFVVSPGLSLITRMDMMERSWGAHRSDLPLVTTNDTLSAGTRAENENIVIDLAYLSYVSPIGKIEAGYLIDGAWGTVFGDSSNPTGKVTYTFMTGGLAIGVQTGKNNEYSRMTANTTDPATVANANASDRDSSFYTAFVNYAWKGGTAGLLGKYIRNAASRSIVAPDNGLTANLYVIVPYAKVQLGPVAVQAEFTHLFGQQDWDGSTPGVGNRADTRYEQYEAFLDATADFGIVYVGGTAAWVSGMDPGGTALTGGVLTGGIDWNPSLILFNSDLSYWTGGQPGYAGAAANAGPMTNAWFGQGRVGVKPVAALDIMGSVGVAYADKKPLNVLHNDYGYEVDVTATYKITNNLSYMLGVGYLFTGSYYKGANDANNISNDFLVINKLTLTF